MALLGLILVLAAVGFGVLVVLDNTDETTLQIGSASVEGISLGVIFLIGAGTALVLAVGLALMGSGARRSRTRRAEVKQLARERDEAHAVLERESQRSRNPVAGSHDQRHDQRTVDVRDERLVDERTGQPSDVRERPSA